MDNKNNNTLLKVLLVIFVLVLLALVSLIIYDKTLKNNSNSPTENLNNNDDLDEDIDETIDEDNQDENSNYISKIDPSNNWIYDTQYEKNVLANSYDILDETYYANDLIVPLINIDSDDATKANEELKKAFDEAINFYNEGVENKTSFVETDYEKYIDDDIASVNFWYGKGEADEIIPNYSTYTFDLATGKIISFEELYQKFNFNKNQVDEKFKEAITNKINNIFEENFSNENSTTYINESINNYEKSLEENTLKYYVNEDGKLSIIARLSIPAESGYQDTILEID